MKKSLLLLACAMLMGMGAHAEDNHGSMLKHWKAWHYTYHHYEDGEPEGVEGLDYVAYGDHYIWPVVYVLLGDTTINDRQYMKMYRAVCSMEGGVKSRSYYAAYREEDGKVYELNKRVGDEERLLIDFSLRYDGAGIRDAVIVEDSIKVDGLFYHRYRYDDTTYDGKPYRTGFVGVEGVGFKGYGLVRHLLDAEPDCLCDYESFDYVFDDWLFSNQDFDAPSWVTLNDDEQALVAENNRFAFNLFREVRQEENLVLSPLSVTFALGMLNNGAAGQTQEEINQVLGFGSAGAEGINRFCRKMLSEAPYVDPGTRVDIANTIFVNSGQGYQLQDLFVQKADTYYDAQPQERNFDDGETRDAINQWASDHTEGMVKEILTQEEFNPYAVSYLLNAIYFNGPWEHRFNPNRTANESFNGGDEVAMMQMQHGEFEYMENDLYQAVKLPYGHGGYTMTVMLPREDKTVGDVLAAMDGKNWQFYSRTHETDLKLPRFETEVSINLKDAMSALGMPRAFDKQRAEFPNFCNRDTYIGLMKQGAKIVVNEEGTESAAVTIIGIETTSMTPHATLHATRPFLYIISEQSTGCIFFIGQFMGTTTAGLHHPSPTAHHPSPTAHHPSSLYNLAGQRLSTPPTRGIYIENGKKRVGGF